MKHVGFRSPMLATAATSLPPGTWIAERKFDGIRLLSHVISSESIKCWSRLGNLQDLPNHLIACISALPPGIYDGELIVPGGTSSDVKDLSNRSKLEYVVFDLLEIDDGDVTGKNWLLRRRYLEEIFQAYPKTECPKVHLAETTPITTWTEVESLANKIWDLGQEGLILKDTTAPYRCGKRTKTFLKVKLWQPAVLTVLGFVPSETEKNNRGAWATTVLRDAQGCTTIVKTLDDETLARAAAAFGDKEGRTFTFERIRMSAGHHVEMITNHPWVGRKLHIEYQTRTPDGNYRHPHWDHWDGE